MNEAKRIQLLKYALILFGLIFIFGIQLLGMIWPSGWVWHGGQGYYYLNMIKGVYAVMGIYMIMAAKNPLEHKSLIWFVVWSSVVHAVVMAYHGFEDSAETGHLIGDVPALILVAAVLGLLMPRSARS